MRTFFLCNGMTMKDFFRKNKICIYSVLSVILFLLPVARTIYVESKNGLYLIDLAAYCDVSRALFKGCNPFPDHLETLVIMGQNDVPIVYPGQMALFALPGFLWGHAVQIGYLALNFAIVFFLTGLTLVKACGYRWCDLRKPGWRQFVYALCCFCFFSSACVMNIMRLGQIVLVLALCLYALFWGPVSRWLRVVLFAFVAVTKYSVLPVVAPLLFFKGRRKLCIAAFSLFVFLSVSPVFCGNDLAEVYGGYYQAIGVLFQPGGVNHYDMSPLMCHFGFFKIPVVNHVLKAVAICMILWLFWHERKTRHFSDTLLLLALSLTMLISYHAIHDLALIFPLLFIRLFDFAKKKQWFFFWGTAIFPLYLMIPGNVILTVSSWIGGIRGIGSVVYLSNHPWGSRFQHVFPVTPFFSAALALWSLYLYFRVKDPYCFEIPESGPAGEMPPTVCPSGAAS